MPTHGKEKHPIPMLLIALLFFLSGFAALIYQISWQRALFTIFGINVEAVTVVVTGFLLGLGFGSLLGGRVSRTSRMNLLILFATIELLVGLCGIVSLDIFQWAGLRALAVPASVTAAVSIALVLLPTLLMGATLPVLTQLVVRRLKNVGQSVGLLYGINTLGSAMACFACCFWLMGNLGLRKVVLLAAAINIVVACAAFWLGWRRWRDSGLPAMSAPMSGEIRKGFGLWPLFVVAALTGYVSLSYEVIWFREFVLGINRSPAFALILGTYLAGLAIGAFFIRNYCETKTVAPVFLLCVAVLLASVLGFLVLPLAAKAAAGGMAPFVMAMLSGVLVQTIVAGATFPLICDLGVGADERTGVGVSYLYVGNILGSAAGTLVTGFFLMDLVPTARISLALLYVGAIAAVAIAFIGRPPIARRRRISIAAVSGLVLVAGPAAQEVSFDRFYERLIYKDALNGEPRFVDIVENKSGVIAVDGNARVFGGGMYDGLASVDLIADKNLLVRPLSLALVHPHPRHVLMIGLATGAWAQVIAAHPGVERLTIVEINPGYLSLIRKYSPVMSILANPKTEIIIDDGRRWLNRHPNDKFDAIIQNTTFHFRPNVTNLLSEEYLRLVAGHLRDGGVAMYNTTGSARAMLTGCAVFPHAIRVLNMMVASNAPLVFDFARMRSVLEGLTIDSHPAFDLSNPAHRSRIDEIIADLAMPGRNIENCDSIRSRSEKLSIITDDNMGEEW